MTNQACLHIWENVILYLHANMEENLLCGEGESLSFSSFFFVCEITNNFSETIMYFIWC